MDQEPHLGLETRSRIPWFEFDCDLTNDVVEIPWKRELDPIATDRCDVVSLATCRSTTGPGRFGRRLLIDLGINGCRHLCFWRDLSRDRCRSPGRCFRRARVGARRWRWFDTAFYWYRCFLNG